jgi:ABC-type Fe3+-hydroxamate transport system substrate-binding protein
VISNYCWLKVWILSFILGLISLPAGAETSLERTKSDQNTSAVATAATSNQKILHLEKILRLKPDLILSNSYMKDIYEQLSQIAPTVVLNYPWPPLGWKKQLEELAQILGKENISQQFMDNYWQRIEKLKQALGERRHTP